MKLFKVTLFLACLFLYPSASPMDGDAAITRLADRLDAMSLYDDGNFFVLPDDLRLYIFTIRHDQKPWKKIGQILEFRTVCKRWYLMLLDINPIAKILKIPPLHLAAALRRADDIITLTLGGASLLEPDDEGFRPAHYAIGVRGDCCVRDMLSIGRSLTTALQSGQTLVEAADHSENGDTFYTFVSPEPVDYSLQDFMDVMKRHDFDELKQMLLKNTSIFFEPVFFEEVASISSQECINLVKYATIGRLQYQIFERLRRKKDVPEAYVQHLKSLSANFNIYDEQGHTLLDRTSRRGRHVPTFQALMADNAIDINLPDKSDGSTPLLKAVSSGYKKRVKSLLATNRCDINCCDHQGYAPLHCLAQDDKNIKLLKQFLSIPGCNIEIRNEHGSTPLLYSVCFGQLGCMKLLIKKKANLLAECIHRHNSLHMAALHGKKECLEELLKSLKDLVNSQDKRGSTPLLLAVQNGHSCCIPLLISAGARVDIKDKYGESPFHYAAAKGNLESIELLAMYGAEIDCVSNADSIAKTGMHFGLYTPLHYAAYKGNFDAVEMLVNKYGADITRKTQFGKTACDLAHEHGHQKVVDFLKSVKKKKK